MKYAATLAIDTFYFLSLMQFLNGISGSSASSDNENVGNTVVL